MNQALAAAEVENPVFFDAFACYREAAKAARRRHTLYIREKNAGRPADASDHKWHADWYIGRARMWRAEMEGVADE